MSFCENNKIIILLFQFTLQISPDLHYLTLIKSIIFLKKNDTILFFSWCSLDQFEWVIKVAKTRYTNQFLSG